MNNSEDLSRCPSCAGPADNGHDRCVPPTAYFCTKCEADLQGIKNEMESLINRVADIIEFSPHRISQLSSETDHIIEDFLNRAEIEWNKSRFGDNILDLPTFPWLHEFATKEKL